MEESQKAVLTWLDSPMANHGFSLQARQQLSEILNADDSYQFFSNIILNPPSVESDEKRTMRSWRAMTLLTDHLKARSSAGIVLLDATKAGLLAKEIFASMDRPDINILHVRTLLEALLEAHPSSVISACCAGGKEGMEKHLGPMLSPKTSSQTLPIITDIVLYGCLGKQGKASAEKTVLQQQRLMQKSVELSHGHRRKFVRVLSDWSIFTRLINCINSHEGENPSIGEDVCETILTIVECLGYPEIQPTQVQPSNTKKVDNIGEESLLAPLGQNDWWEPLVAILDGDTSNEAKVATTRIMMGIFTLATGRSTRIRKLNSVMTDATEKNYGETKVNEEIEAGNKSQPTENKLLEWGLTSKIHNSLLEHLPKLIHGLLRGLKIRREEEATQYFVRGVSTDNIPGVPHPGRCRIVPFTSWRLHVVTLLAEILTYTGIERNIERQGIVVKKEDAEALRLLAMDAVMALKLPLELQSNSEQALDDDAIVNPWPFLCDWIFEYPENALYHCQFIRLFKAICMEHHEASLRLVLQKVKFVSRAIKICAKSSANRGALLVCMNVLRLRSHSLPPSAFLRQFLESHDAWKGFKEELIRITLEQEMQSHPVPSRGVGVKEKIDIDLGSRYAALLGFDGIKTFQLDNVTTQESQIAVASGGKKKKKRKKKKKGKDSNSPKDAANNISS